MKVFDLCCSRGHSFEGWFASEDDFQDQRSRRLMACPLCEDHDVTKLPSAPRLNLGGAESASRVTQGQQTEGAEQGGATGKVLPTASSGSPVAALQAAFAQAVQQMVAQTEDVGERFSEEARRIHYGEAQERSIRGQATREQAEELLDEGIPVLPLPSAFKGPLQ